jgi:hypothetical protein
VFAPVGDLPDQLVSTPARRDRFQQSAGTGRGEQHLGKGGLPVQRLGDGLEIAGWVQTMWLLGDPGEEVAEEWVEWRRSLGDGVTTGSISVVAVRSTHGDKWYHQC